MFRYRDIRASSYCNLPKSFYNSTSIVKIINDDNYCFLWSILAHKYKVDYHSEKVSNYKKSFQDLFQGDIQFPVKIKDIPFFEILNNLNINVFELSAIDKTLSPKYIKKNYNNEQKDLLLYENHYCLLTNLHHFCRNKEHYKHLCRRCSITYGDQTKLEEHKLRCIEQKVCNTSCIHLNQKMKFIDWYMKIDPPISMAADFECMKIPLNDNDNGNDNDNVNVNDSDHDTDKLFVNNPVSIFYNVVKNSEYENLNLKKMVLSITLVKIVLNGS